MEKKIEVKVIITGRVQGVYYRAHALEAANKYDTITGYVKNRPDGAVLAVFQGDRTDVDAMVQWCWKGSPSCAVSKLKVQTQDSLSKFNGFEIRY